MQGKMRFTERLQDLLQRTGKQGEKKIPKKTENTPANHPLITPG